jgi:hypothetical protein
MITRHEFELGIPTNISFTLYRYDYIDSIIISRVLKECKNHPTGQKGVYKISIEGFKRAIETSSRLTKEVEKAKLAAIPTPNLKVNSIFFLWNIMDALVNLKWLTFKISEEKEYSRIMEVHDREILTFHYNIEEGVFNLTEILNREELDEFNKELITNGIMENKYFDRMNYIWMRASNFFDLIASFEKRGSSISHKIYQAVDPKIDEDDPTLLVITDYTNY